MSLQKQVEQKVARMKPGQVITYRDFSDLPTSSPYSLPKIFQRLIEKGILVREKSGTFYKPRKTIFGNLRPSEEKFLEFMLIEKDRYCGYISGQDVFLKFKMSTQVPSITTIATEFPTKKTTIGNLRIRYVRNLVPTFRKSDIEKLQLLDSIRFIKKALDASPDNITTRVFEIISMWETIPLRQLCNLAQNYPPATKVLLGAILENIKQPDLAASLKAKLNPSTSYQLGISESVLPNKKAWRIQ